MTTPLKTYVLALAAVCAAVLALPVAAQPSYYVAVNVGQAETETDDFGYDIGVGGSDFSISPDFEDIEANDSFYGVAIGSNVNEYFRYEVGYREMDATGRSAWSWEIPETLAAFNNFPAASVLEGGANHPDPRGRVLVEGEITALYVSVFGEFPFTEKASAYVELGYEQWELDADITAVISRGLDFVDAVNQGVPVGGRTVSINDIERQTVNDINGSDGNDFFWGVGVRWKANENWMLYAEWEMHSFDTRLGDIDSDALGFGVQYQF